MEQTARFRQPVAECPRSCLRVTKGTSCPTRCSPRSEPWLCYVFTSPEEVAEAIARLRGDWFLRLEAPQFGLLRRIQPCLESPVLFNCCSTHPASPNSIRPKTDLCLAQPSFTPGTSPASQQLGLLSFHCSLQCIGGKERPQGAGPLNGKIELAHTTPGTIAQLAFSARLSRK
jgi:hypothetical protein